MGVGVGVSRDECHETRVVSEMGVRKRRCGVGRGTRIGRTTRPGSAHVILPEPGQGDDESKALVREVQVYVDES